jgi:predicted transcriptional regulator
MKPTPDSKAVRKIARVAYEVNRAYCAALDDHSFGSWEQAQDWQKDTCIEGVIFHLTGDHGPEESHENWLRKKAADGWVHGPAKDPGASPPTHPCMVPFDELPRTQQVKDHLFRAVVHALKEA